LWKWQSQIGETITTGKASTRLMGITAYRVQQRIDRALMARVPTETRQHEKAAAMASATTAPRLRVRLAR